MSSLLIQKIGREGRGKKRRRLNDGQVEEDKRNEDEDAMIDDFIGDHNQHAQEDKIPLPGSTGKIIGTRANKKRHFDKFRKDQASALSELMS